MNKRKGAILFLLVALILLCPSARIRPVTERDRYELAARLVLQANFLMIEGSFFSAMQLLVGSVKAVPTVTGLICLGVCCLELEDFDQADQALLAARELAASGGQEQAEFFQPDLEYWQNRLWREQGKRSL